MTDFFYFPGMKAQILIVCLSQTMSTSAKAINILMDGRIDKHMLNGFIYYIEFTVLLKILLGCCNQKLKLRYTITLSRRSRIVPYLYRCCKTTHRKKMQIFIVVCVLVYKKRAKKLHFLFFRENVSSFRLYYTAGLHFDRFGSTSKPSCVQELPYKI